MIYVSTGQIPNSSACKIANNFIQNDIKNIELSAGVYEKDLIKKLLRLKKEYKCNFHIHNYFPPSKIPFTFNLASLDSDIYTLSLNHAKDSIKLSSELGNNVYSFHAGYLVDPNPRQLGKEIREKKINNRKDTMKIYLDRLNIISSYAKEKEVELLLENNVLSKKNFSFFKANPFLMTNYLETINIMENTNSNINLVVDLAHLKVSAKTENFDPRIFLRKCKKWIKSYHLSDNNGLSDTNDLIKENSWFWPHIKKNLNNYCLEIKKKQINIIKSQKNLIKQFLRNDKKNNK